jgi:hypothetical protein
LIDWSRYRKVDLKQDPGNRFDESKSYARALPSIMP